MSDESQDDILSDDDIDDLLKLCMPPIENPMKAHRTTDRDDIQIFLENEQKSKMKCSFLCTNGDNGSLICPCYQTSESFIAKTSENLSLYRIAPSEYNSLSMENNVGKVIISNMRATAKPFIPSQTYYQTQSPTPMNIAQAVTKDEDQKPLYSQVLRRPSYSEPKPIPEKNQVLEKSDQMTMKQTSQKNDSEVDNGLEKKFKSNGAPKTYKRHSHFCHSTKEYFNSAYLDQSKFNGNPTMD